MTEINSKVLERITITDFPEICRICPSRVHLTPLCNNAEIVHMLHYCTSIQFHVNDGLPNKICQKCLVKLKQSYQFIVDCKLVDETYRNLQNSQKAEIKMETIYIEPTIKQEFEAEDTEIKQEPQTLIEYDEPEAGAGDLTEFVQLGVQNGCNSIIMRHLTERRGPEQLSLHTILTNKHTHSHYDYDYKYFMRLCQAEMTEELCASALQETTSMRRHPELSLELRYGRITSSKIYSVSCCETCSCSEPFLETIIGFYKIAETKNAKSNESHLQKIEKQLNVKINKRGLILNRDYPEFVAKCDGVTTDDALVKLKFLKNRKDYQKYVDEDQNVNAKTKTEMHLCMLMANLKTSYLCIVDPGYSNTNTCIKVDFNERYFAEILQKSRNFWMENVFPVLRRTIL